MAPMSTTALAAILTGVGITLLGLLVGLSVLLVRAIKNHKRLLADIEERGVSIAQAQAESKREATKITKPRTVLKRTAILPFNNKSGWGTLPSVESIAPPEPPQFPPHYTPPRPAGCEKPPPRLAWPFSARRGPNKAIQMRNIRVPILSTVIESPKPSPLVPVLSGSLGGGRPPSPRRNGSRPTSDQSLLQHHPAFRNHGQNGEQSTASSLHPDPLRRSLTAMPAYKTGVRIRPNRSRSLAEIPMSSNNLSVSHLPHAKLHVRSTSVCSQSSGNAPEAPMPPLPLEIARLKSQEKRRTLLSQSPSRFSVSSFESAGSSILATQSSPILSRSGNARVQKVTKRGWRNSVVVGGRPIRDTLILHGKNQHSPNSTKSNATRFHLQTPGTAHQSQSGSTSSTMTNSSSMQSVKVKTAESVTLSKLYSPSGSPLTVRSYTPRRKSGSQVTAYGSPKERRRGPLSGNYGVPSRQLSQASTNASSTRSSNGNPFQWDPAPLSSGKPSALKGSPSARKGHRRQNCVRISLAPTILGPSNRSSSPSNIHDIQEESPGDMTDQRSSIDLGFSSPRSLPRLPSSSILSQDFKITATSIHATLTNSSPTLSMPDYDHGPIGSGKPSTHDSNRNSSCSEFSIPKFPSPCHRIELGNSNSSPPPKFALSRPSNEYVDDFGRQFSPFKIILPEFFDAPDQSHLPDEYDPERPHLIYQKPQNSSTADGISSAFPTILEEQSATPSPPTMEKQGLQAGDSPPCSPKTMRPNCHLDELQDSFPQYSVQYSTILEETPLECINPAILSNDNFAMLNSGFDTNSGALTTEIDSQNNIPKGKSVTRKSLFEPLAGATSSSNLPMKITEPVFEPRTTLTAHSSPSSLYSSPSLSPSLLPCPPCAPRPRHAQLPPPSLNFTSMPTLSPSLNGPRKSPPRPLRTSIAQLRRMNSDAEKGGKDKAGRGERRYLRLGREDSIALPGEESFLDELDVEDDSTFDEEKGRRLVGDLLDWEEEATFIALDDEKNKTDPEDSTGIGTTPFSNERKQRKSLQPQTYSPSSNLHRSSSIWEDGEKFWQSTPPPNSPNKPRNTFLSLSSPVGSPTSKKSRKRDFEVAKDDSLTETENRSSILSASSVGDSGRKMASCRYRKRKALGIASTFVNANIQVQPPSSGNDGTPGSLYDADGFLRG